MFSKVLRRLTATKAVEFCDQCAQVCSSDCRAETLYAKTRELATYQHFFIR